MRPLLALLLLAACAGCTVTIGQASIHLPSWVIVWAIPCGIAMLFLSGRHRPQGLWDIDLVTPIVAIAVVVWTLAFWIGRMLP